MIQQTRPRTRIRLKKKRIAFLLTVLAFIIITITVLRGINSLNSMYVGEAWGESLSSTHSSGRVNFLIAGIDYLEDGRDIAQKTVLVSYSPQEDSIAAFYIPGKTYVDIEDYGGTGLERVYTLEGPPQRAPLFIDTVSQLLDVPVHYFVELDYRVIPRAVEIAGELELEIVEPLYHQERRLFEEGKQSLSGEEAYRFYSTKMEGEDSLDQLERQRKLTAVLVDSISSKGFFTGLPSAVRNLSSHLQTNLSWRETVYYHDTFREKSYEKDVVLETISGNLKVVEGEEFWVVEEELVKEQVKGIALKDEKDEKEEEGEEKGVEEAEAREEEEAEGEGEEAEKEAQEKEGEGVVPELITVEVLNGTGIPDEARQVAEKLTQKGYEIVKVEDADYQEYPRSQVISRVKDIEPAKDIAIAIPGSQLLKEVITDYPAHVTVITGYNYSEKELTEDVE